MNFSVGESLIFEEIKVKVVEVKSNSVVFEVSGTGYEGDEGGLMEVSMSCLKEKRSQLKRCT
jgi:hypothetical protein